jgi:endonuclease YncB( thermonuclease family)
LALSPPEAYTYRAFVESVYDGDTIQATLDLGMDIKRKCSCRLAEVDTPEIRTKVAGEKEAAYRARDRVRELVLGKWVIVHSIQKPDKYGRLLVRVWTEEGVYLNQLLLDEKLAIPYDGGTKVSWANWT